MMKKYMLSLALISSSVALAGSKLSFSDFPEKTGCKVLGKEALTLLANQYAPKARLTYKGITLVGQGDIVQAVTDTIVTDAIKGTLQYNINKDAKKAAKDTVIAVGTVLAREKLVQIANEGINKVSKATGIERPAFIKKDATLNYIADTLKDYTLRYAAALLLKQAAERCNLPKKTNPVTVNVPVSPTVN